MLNFLGDNTKNFEVTETVGGFNSGSSLNSFDDIYTEAYESLMAAGIDPMRDINEILKKKTVLSAFKDSLLGELKTECEHMMEDTDSEYGTHIYAYEQLSDLFDNCVDDMITESTRVPSLLPIKAVDFPVLIKQQLKLACKDIMQTEVTKSPVIKKHIEQTYIVNKQNKSQRWKYPQCFFDDKFKEIYKAGKGLEIKDTPVSLPAIDFDIVTNLTDGGDVDKDRYTMDLRIEKVIVKDSADEDVVVVLHRPMRINMSDNTWLGGNIDVVVKDSTGADMTVKDIVMGYADPQQKVVQLNSLNGTVKSVVFSGFLSNERNERAVTFDYARVEMEWKIEDGFRADVSYSLEELQDTKALMDIDLYKKTYNNLAEILTQMEDSNVLDWLDQMFDKYDGVELDPLQWNSFITKTIFDCDCTYETTALPNEFIEKMLKFHIDGLLIDIADKAKLEDMTFVIYGNPRFIRFLNPVVNWVTRPGSTMNGIKLDYGYGIMTSGDIKVQVVSTKKVNASYDSAEKSFSGVRIIPFPLNKEQFTFKHYKYTTHILTGQNSNYRDAELPGGSQTYLMGNSRYTNAEVQGIQAQVKLGNAERYINL